MQSPTNAKNIALNPSLTLADYGVSTALEPYAPTTSIAPARTARVSMTWRAEAVLKDFLVRLKLFDPDGRLISQKDEAPIRGLYPASHWQRGEFVNDVHNFLIPAGSPPGKYQLKLQTLDSATKQSTSDEIALASLDIERATNLTRDQVFMAHQTDRDFGSSVPYMIWGYGGFDGTYHAGDKLAFYVVYFVKNDIDLDFPPMPFELYQYDSPYSYHWSWSSEIIPFYPTKEWHKGEVLKAYYDITIPNNIPSGEIDILTWGSTDMSILGTFQIAP